MKKLNDTKENVETKTYNNKLVIMDCANGTIEIIDTDLEDEEEIEEFIEECGYDFSDLEWMKFDKLTIKIR